MSINEFDHELRADAQARTAALNTDKSFIVQAPAGSGKTELLIQRMLSLLARVNNPSEVLAITFTRKAAGEMRERLLSALFAARNHPEPTQSPAKERWQLARAVIARDSTLNWRIADRPALLAIETFDAFSLRITKLAPLAEAGTRVSLATLQEDASLLHADAARRALLQATEPAHVAAVLTLLSALDNRVSDIVNLIAALLGKRAQWIHNLIDDSDEAIDAMRTVMVESIQKETARLSGLWPKKHTDQATALAAYGAEHATDAQKQQHWLVLAASTLRANTLDSLSEWAALSKFVLTGDGTWRKQFNVRDGFAAPGDKGLPADEKLERTQAKQNVVQFIADLKEIRDSEALREALIAVCALPDAAAIAAHEPILRAALYVLKIATAELALLEQERAVTDFSGVAIAAKSALLEFRDEVFARLDTRVHHVLVDEFQDTNPAQASLIATLTEDWRNDDGHTLFLVGDPMQSIYGFRDADVGIFMDVWLHGMGNVRLEALTLSANYRSRPEVIEWVNTTLAPVFSQPSRVADAPRIHFARAAAIRTTNDDAHAQSLQPTLHAYADSEEEASAIVHQINRIQRENPEYRVAIIVRAKNHANAILRVLQTTDITFIARNMAPWSDRPLIRDLLSLSYVLTQPVDRLSWYAWLRSPMVGLTLTTFAQLSEWQAERQIETESALRDPVFLSALNAEERNRVTHATTSLKIVSEMSDLGTLAERVHALFRFCGGDLIASTPESRAEVEDFLAFLDDNTSDAHLPPRAEFEALLKKQFQSFSSKNSLDSSMTQPVEILTIHKAKGLEWDIVFLPQIDRVPPPESRALIVWDFVRLQRTANDIPNPSSNRASAQLLVGAKETRRRSDNSVFQFVHDRRTAARAEESKRLLYVAVTRARERLILSGAATKANASPNSRSLAALMDWPLRETDDEQSTQPATSMRTVMRKSLTRLSQLPQPPTTSKVTASNSLYVTKLGRNNTQSISQSNDIAIGIVGHKLLEGFAYARSHEHAHAHTSASADRDKHPLTFTPSHMHIVHALVTAGAYATDAPGIASRLERTFKALESSTHIEALFSATHQSVANEFTIITNRIDHDYDDDDAAQGGATTISLRVDRTFITADDTRWIVDYKFSAPTDAVLNDSTQLTAWLKTQCEQHAAQLTDYANAFALIEPNRHIVKALYHPLIDQLTRL
jgi:ATP-dependent helicase/nuclease subunit A